MISVTGVLFRRHATTLHCSSFDRGGLQHCVADEFGLAARNPELPDASARGCRCQFL